MLAVIVGIVRRQGVLAQGLAIIEPKSEAGDDIALSRQAEELARSNAELQVFAQNVAHDLREPLRTISSFTTLLVRKVALDPQTREIADFVVDGVSRMTTLIEGLLSSASYGFKGALDRVEMEQAALPAMQNLKEAIASSAAKIGSPR